MLTLGSLFDGIGGFPLAALRHGIRPVWASEIEPVCIGITKSHFPQMRHLGDITLINGASIEPVDIITFGSPCQDLSIAGKRAGLDGARSGLFREAVRIINEMREATDGHYPTFIVWENVAGALSSSHGLDFKAVLEEITQSEIPVPNSGKWADSGMVRSGRCDCGWRVLDAQFWGVPQRRRRIFLVADFAEERAAQVLFKPEGLRRDITAGAEAWEGFAASIGNDADVADGRIAIPVNMQLATRHVQLGRGTGFGIGESGDPAFTLQAAHSHAVAVYPEIARTLIKRQDGSPCVDRGANMVVTQDVDCLTPWDSQGKRVFNAEGVSPTLSGCDKGGGRNPGGFVFDCRGNGASGQESFTLWDMQSMRIRSINAPASTLQAEGGGAGAKTGLYLSPLVMATGQANAEILRDVSPTLNCNHEQPIVAGYAVRRLTPLECERLQGFPDFWTEGTYKGKPISDSARYAAIGNSVAIPCVEYFIGGIAEVLRGEGAERTEGND